MSMSRTCKKIGLQSKTNWPGHRLHGNTLSEYRNIGFKKKVSNYFGDLMIHEEGMAPKPNLSKDILNEPLCSRYALRLNNLWGCPNKGYVILPPRKMNNSKKFWIERRSQRQQSMK